jgi:NitT/TauT family transport system ATP-binding protein
MNRLELHITRKQFAHRSTGTIEVIRDLSLSVGEAEIVAVLGPSGCGKTTMLQIVAGLDSDFEGDVRMAPGVADHMAYVFQSPRLLPWRTARQNIELVFDEPTSHAEAITQTLGAVGLSGFEDTYPEQLSLGMQRRAALARAFVTEPKLLLMDEPFVSLDETLAARLRALLKSLLQDNPASVLLVTHDWREAVDLADRLVLLTPGPTHVATEIANDLPDSMRRDESSLQEFRQRYDDLLAQSLQA